MKLKYYLRGLGIGIFATVIILTIASSGKNKELTDEEIIARAEELGMVMQDRTGSILDHLEGSSSDGQPQGTGDGAAENGGEPSGNASTPEGSLPQDGTGPDTAPEGENPAEEPVTDPLPESGQETSYVSIDVGEGEFSDQISAKLKEAGLIEDAEEFNRFLIDSGIDDLIYIGTYRIPKGASYEEIAGILRGAPESPAQ